MSQPIICVYVHVHVRVVFMFVSCLASLHVHVDSFCCIVVVHGLRLFGLSFDPCCDLALNELASLRGQTRWPNPLAVTRVKLYESTMIHLPCAHVSLINRILNP